MNNRIASNIFDKLDKKYRDDRLKFLGNVIEIH